MAKLKKGLVPRLIPTIKSITDFNQLVKKNFHCTSLSYVSVFIVNKVLQSIDLNMA